MFEAKFVCHGELTRGARKLMGENLKVAWSEFSTLTKATNTAECRVENSAQVSSC